MYQSQNNSGRKVVNSGNKRIFRLFPEFTIWYLRKEGDRKSTRLNSSHQIISYAVFCLKQKKTRLHSSHQIMSYAALCLKKKTTTRLTCRKLPPPRCPRLPLCNERRRLSCYSLGCQREV